MAGGKYSASSRKIFQEPCCPPIVDGVVLTPQLGSEYALVWDVERHQCWRTKPASSVSGDCGILQVGNRINISNGVGRGDGEDNSGDTVRKASHTVCNACTRIPIHS